MGKSARDGFPSMIKASLVGFVDLAGQGGAGRDREGQEGPGGRGGRG